MENSEQLGQRWIKRGGQVMQGTKLISLRVLLPADKHN